MAPFTVTAHPYPSPTRHSTAYETGLPNAQNALVFIGGLGDGPHTVPYVRSISDKLKNSPELSFSVFELRMASSFSGFGFSTLKRDVLEIAALVRYLRSLGKDKIFLMGHSTGCQVRTPAVSLSLSV